MSAIVLKAEYDVWSIEMEVAESSSALTEAPYGPGDCDSIM